MVLSYLQHEVWEGHVESFRVPDCVRYLLHNLAKLSATFFQRAEPHVLAAQHQQIEGIEHYRWRSAAEALKKVERRPAALVQGNDLAVNDSVVWQVHDRLRNSWKAAGEVFLIP